MARPATGQVVVRKRKGGKTFGLRFRAYGKRRYLSLGSTEEGWNQRQAEEELANVLADVRRGIWKPAPSEKASDEAREPTFHEFASEWLASRRHEFAARTVEDYELALSHHLLPFFKDHRLSEITAHEADRYKAAKVREREQGEIKRPLSNRTINKTLTRLGQILDAAVRYDLLDHNPVKAKVEKLKEAEPRRARLTGEQVQVLLRVAGEHRALIATAIMAGGLRVSELTHLRWRDVDLREGLLNVAASKTTAGVRQVVLDPELVQLLRKHKLAAQWTQPDDFVFAGRIREQPRERNSVRTRILYGAVEKANELLAAEDRSPLPDGLTFHSLRRTYAALRAELGEHPAITAAQMGHRDPRMTLRVYTDVTGMRPRTRMGWLLSGSGWPERGWNATSIGDPPEADAARSDRERMFPINRTMAVALPKPRNHSPSDTRHLQADPPDDPIPFLDLFAGAGGLSIGLMRNGFKPAGAVEIVEDAALSYEARHDVEVDRRRLEDIPERDLRSWRDSVQMVVGGPPCQPWSTGGLRLADRDERDGFPAMLRALRLIKPEAFIVENVAGFERGRARPYFVALLNALEELGYSVVSKTLNAADFGVPQHRRRTFIVGTRASRFDFPEPTHGPDRESPWIAAGEVLGASPLGAANTAIVTYAKRPQIRPSPYDGLLFNGGGRPINLLEPARTILASAGGNKTPFIDTEGIVPEYHARLWDSGTGKPRPAYKKAVRKGKVAGARRITVEESARLQSFPSDMVFHGTRSSQYTLVGNAVPPRLAAAVGKAIHAALTSTPTG